MLTDFLSKKFKQWSPVYWARLQLVKTAEEIQAALNHDNPEIVDFLLEKSNYVQDLRDQFFTDPVENVTDLAWSSFTQSTALLGACPRVQPRTRKGLCEKVQSNIRNVLKLKLAEDEQLILNLSLCEASLHVLDWELNSEIYNRGQEKNLTDIKRIIERIITHVEGRKNNISQILENDFIKFRAYYLNAQTCRLINGLPWNRVDVSYSQRAIENLEALLLLWAPRFFRLGIDSKIELARLKAQIGEKTENISLTKDACSMLIATASQIKENQVTLRQTLLQSLAQAAASGVIIDPSDEDFSKIAFSSASALMDFPNAPFEARLSVVRASILANMARNNWKAATDLFEKFVTFQATYLSTCKTQEDIRNYANHAERIGDLSAYCYSKLDEPHKAVLAAESTRSLFWKYIATQNSSDSDFVQRSLSGQLALNSDTLQRVNISISICDFGVSWTVLWREGDENHIKTYSTDKFDSKFLLNNMFGAESYLNEYYQFATSLNTAVGNEFEAAFQNWNAVLAQTLNWLWDALMAEIHQSLIELGIEPDTHVHLLPTGLLGLLPLQSAGSYSEREGWNCFSDHWTVTVSDTMAHENFRPKQQTQYSYQFGAAPDDSPKRFGITNPTGDLGIETNPANKLPGFVDLCRENASKNEIVRFLRKCSLASFFCHARCEQAAPATSYFILSNQERLMLEEIYKLELENNPTVFLGSCESGIYEVFQENEAYGLAAGLLWAGAKSVAATYWPVTVGTAAKTIENLADQYSENPQRIPTALTLLQRNMRRGAVTAEPKANIPESNVLTLRPTKKMTLEGDFKGGSSVADFSQPAHWAVYAIHAR
ncbi:CHAT domain-containing protein [Roseibium sp.]|uniref:CHAT domain-containing protein n=1 Tax=Roseibium sp. TaxID=1936156 RepID=UPI003A984EF8